MDLVRKLYYCYVEKLFQIQGVLVRADIRQGLICLRSDYALQQLVKKGWIFVEQLAGDLRQAHQTLYGRELRITKKSLVIELLGHVYTYQICSKLRRVFPQGLFRTIAYRSCKIECGQTELDNNRWVWDLLSFFKPLFFLFTRRP